MATRTTTFDDVRRKYAALVGLDPANIIPSDALAFTEYLNRNYRVAWARAQWPFATDLDSFVPNSVGFVDLSTDTDIGDILDVFSADPFTDRTADPLRYNVRRDGLFVPAAALAEPLAVSTLVSVGTLATCNTVDPHNYGTGNTVIIAGANESDYNGKFEITVTSTTEFTYVMGADPVDTATGTITSTKTTVFIFFRTNEQVFDGTLTTTLEFLLQDYLASASYADWLGAEGQQNKSQATRATAEAFLDIEVDRLERQTQQQLPSRTGSRIVGTRKGN